MSLDLFKAVPAGAIEVLTDTTSKPYFKRADLGRFLGIARIKDMFKDVKTVFRQSINQGAVLNSPSLRQNNHDVFVDLDSALEIVVRSRKPKAVELVKWLIRKGAEKVMEEQQRALEVKDAEIEDLTQKVAAIELAHETELEELEEEVNDLIQNRHVPHRGPYNVLCFVDEFARLFGIVT